jgi:hypothetical protein
LNPEPPVIQRVAQLLYSELSLFHNTVMVEVIHFENLFCLPSLVGQPALSVHTACIAW